MDTKVPGSELIEVDFRPRDQDIDPALRIKRHNRYKDCEHWRTLIDENLRTVKCRDCGEQLDPVEVLILWAEHWERYTTAVTWLRDTRDRLHKEIEQLTAARKSLMSAVARDRRAAGQVYDPRTGRWSQPSGG